MISQLEFDNLMISHNKNREDKYKVYLNYNLAFRQARTKEDILEILELHDQKNKIVDEIMTSADVLDCKNIDKLLTEIEKLDFKVQKAWGFKRDKDKLSWVKMIEEEYPAIKEARFLKECKEDK